MHCPAESQLSDDASSRSRASRRVTSACNRTGWFWTAAESGKPMAGDVRRRARHRDQRVELDHRFDGVGRQRDPLAGNGDDQQKLVHRPRPPAVLSATSKAARS